MKFKMTARSFGDALFCYQEEYDLGEFFELEQDELEEMSEDEILDTLYRDKQLLEQFTANAVDISIDLDNDEDTSR